MFLLDDDDIDHDQVGDDDDGQFGQVDKVGQPIRFRKTLVIRLREVPKLQLAFPLPSKQVDIRVP